MTRTEFEEQLDKVAQVQRQAGWKDVSIAMYAYEMKLLCLDTSGMPLPSVIGIGAGLACDNSRFGVL